MNGKFEELIKPDGVNMDILSDEVLKIIDKARKAWPRVHDKKYAHMGGGIVDVAMLTKDRNEWFVEWFGKEE